MESYYITIIDKKTRQIVCSGKIKNWKIIDKYKFSSIDGIYFFKETCDGSEPFKFAKNIFCEKIDINHEIINKYNIVNWNQRWIYKDINNRTMNCTSDVDKFLIDPKNIDIYKESPYDKECVLLINALNNINGIKTITSCCGHGYKNFQISFYCKNINSLIFLSDIINEDTTLSISLKNNIPKKENCLSIMLTIHKKGTEAYVIADNLANDISIKYKG